MERLLSTLQFTLLDSVIFSYCLVEPTFTAAAAPATVALLRGFVIVAASPLLHALC